MTPYLADPDFILHNGDALETLRGLPSESVHCVVTSPPYLDARPEYDSPTAAEWRDIFRELRRVVSGPALFNVGRLWRDRVESLWWVDLLTLARSEGWELLDTLVWVKPNANPIHGQVLADSHEYVFVLGRQDTPLNADSIRTEYDPETLLRFKRRYQNQTGVKGEVREVDGRTANEGGARARSFFIAFVGREKGNEHPCPMPDDLAEHLIRLASWPGQTVLDPFMGSGTTALVARRLGRRSVGIELNADYCALAARRLQQMSLLAA